MEQLDSLLRQALTACLPNFGADSLGEWGNTNTFTLSCIIYAQCLMVSIHEDNTDIQVAEASVQACCLNRKRIVLFGSSQRYGFALVSSGQAIECLTTGNMILSAGEEWKNGQQTSRIANDKVIQCDTHGQKFLTFAELQISNYPRPQYLACA